LIIIIIADYIRFYTKSDIDLEKNLRQEKEKEKEIQYYISKKRKKSKSNLDEQTIHLRYSCAWSITIFDRSRYNRKRRRWKISFFLFNRMPISDGNNSNHNNNNKCASETTVFQPATRPLDVMTSSSKN